jgi:hypothetical protein
MQAQSDDPLEKAQAEHLHLLADLYANREDYGKAVEVWCLLGRAPYATSVLSSDHPARIACFQSALLHVRLPRPVLTGLTVDFSCFLLIPVRFDSSDSSPEACTWSHGMVIDCFHVYYSHGANRGAGSTGKP